uniref:Uncharacterized protein n=1 Tax=Chromera velia CCMP2878 TaxID=1169474 RepID=A0A0G4FFQ4_9ALVE|mmetsp:Transcript_10379/g.20113  ORF Transcript_10379/g.20113 Transcript_10379/m.20113 type:complete len:480 (-) Transcript_10379:553-1992(-)|eukprot:Cvel_3266.t1-p1 / transcript=Cvel_3266.t1 / gene=Cvel_3266 / organism=Chromera_velia_CCMP2878 / gene_product=hypothetical protein / transcript_product=hypothetical protein / location=Cvel_scaffold128:51880-54083(+) / protein_length=479 / sequence_SO=supercontig / SO=protein_coding / is_pseudo=false
MEGGNFEVLTSLRDDRDVQRSKPLWQRGGFILAVSVACLIAVVLIFRHPSHASGGNPVSGAKGAGGSVPLSLAAAGGGEEKAGIRIACDDPMYSKKVLKTVYENSYFGLLHKTYGQQKFEASDIKYVGDNFYAVCDSSWGLGKFERSLQPFGEKNVELWGEGKEELEGDAAESQWEAIVYDDKTGMFIGIQEAMPKEDEEAAEESLESLVEEVEEKGEEGADILTQETDTAAEKAAAGEGEVVSKPQAATSLRSSTSKRRLSTPVADVYTAIMQELKLDEENGSYAITKECPSEFTFTNGNKGFEGAAGLRMKSGELLILAVCEGNHCEGGKKGKEVGNGLGVLMKKEEDKDGSCIWKTLKTVNLPKAAEFVDYSALAIKGKRVAVTSQENSAVWLGELEGVDKDGVVADPKKVAFSDKGEVMFFPRDTNCMELYCNVEGIDFINEHLLVAASDQMKKRGRQDFRCLAKDQSVHVFQIP